MADVLIVGAGPAGVAAAVPLAAAGRDVVLVDKAVFPRDKCCGDGLTTLALRELERSASSRRRSPTGRSSTTPCCARRRGGRSSCRCPPGRARSPPSPTDAARRGARRRRRSRPAPPSLQGHGADGTISPHADHVVVGLDDHEPVAARYVIAADGMWSPIRKALGLGEPGYLGEWHAFRQYVPTSTGRPPSTSTCGSTPTSCPATPGRSRCPTGRANVGFGVLRDGTRRIQDMKAAVGRAARPPPRAGGARPRRRRSRDATRRGRSRPASTGPRWPTAACCSPATRRWPPT